jgi:hypothetical protein
MVMDYEEALDYSARWMDLIRREEFPSQAEAHQIINESKENFAEPPFM